MGKESQPGWVSSENSDWAEAAAFVAAVGRRNADRHDAIVAGVKLEEALGELLASFLVDQKQSHDLLHGILNNFATRINLAYCLGLISPDEYADLHTMREIRNYFAHGKEGSSFNDKYVTDLCDKLITIRKNPLYEEESEDYLSLYLGSAAVLLYILSIGNRTSTAQNRRCVVPDEIDPATWHDWE